MSATSAEKNGDEGKLVLSLDSGWIESSNIFSQLHIIDEAMHQYEYDMGLPDHSVKPHEVFDMIIGTGSGGLLAAMLGPLKMTTQEALASLHTLYQSTFNPPASLKTKLFDFVNWLVFWLMYLCADLFSYKHLTLNSRATIIAPEILEKRLTKAIQELVVQRLRKDGLSTRLQEVEQLIPKCKFAVTAMSSVHVASPTVFRGYRSRTASPDCTLVDALRATLANARLFPAVAIGHPIVQTYIGADAGYPNPIETVLHEMETVYHHNYIAIILSVGSGRRETISIDGPTSFPEAIVKLVSSAQAASERVISRFSHHPEAYCRLDVDQLQYTTSPSPANVEVDSRAYLAREEVRQQLDALTVLMRSRPLTVKVCDIGRAKAGGLARAIQDIPIRISTHDSLKTLSYAERASFNPDLVCLKGTRTHILAIVFDWMEEAAAKPVLMWLEGVFGSGKSFVAHSVAVKAHQLGILGSSFFMTPCTTVRRVEGQTLGINEPASLKNLVTSLIIDLGALSETFRWTVGEILNHQPRLASATPSIQLAEVLLPSLSSLSKDLTFVWVIDGFDELMRYPDREAADRFFETLCSSLSDFPPNFLIFITSRPLPNHPLPQLPAIHHLMLDLLSPQNTQDLDLISYAELEELAAANRAFSIPSPDQQLAVAFRRKAGGHPLWLRIVREYLLTSLTPNEELEELLNLEGNGSSDYHQLMNLTYGQVITRSIDLNNSKNRKTLKHVIIVFLARQQPLPHSTLLDILNDSSELPPTTFRSVTSHLRPLLLGFNTTNPLEFIHLSLRDFFASSASFNDLIQDVPSPRDLSPGHFTLLRSAFRVMETHLRPEVPVERYHCDHPALAYSAAAWTTHLIHLDPLVYESQLTSHLSSFLDQSFMAWLVYHETLGLPFLFTHEFLEQAKRLAGHIWNEKVISRRDAVEKLDDLRQKFEYSGRFDHWRLCSDQAVQLWRVQAPSDIEGQRGLYKSLVDRARGLREFGLNEDAFIASHEAVAICRSLNSQECQDFKSADLAWILACLSVDLAGAGQHAEALAANEEAVLLRRQLVQDRARIHEADLAISLNDFSNRLSDAGRHAEALVAIEESVSLYRQVVQDRPKDFDADLARSLSNLSIRLRNAGQHTEALVAIEEAVMLRQQLVLHRPNVFEADLAATLDNFSVCLSDAGRHAEALSATEEAVSLYQQLVKNRPKVFEGDLAIALSNFSNCLSEAGRNAEALTAIEETVSLFRQLTQDRPKVFESNLAATLANLSACLSAVGRHAEALATVEEAIVLQRRLVHDRPNVFEAELAVSLMNYSSDLSDASRHPEALAANEEALVLRRQLVEDQPNVFEADLATTLDSFSVRLSDAGRDDEALSAIEEAISLFRQLTQERPKIFKADLARSLFKLSFHLPAADRHAEALSAIREAVSLYQKLELDRPNSFEVLLQIAKMRLSQLRSNYRP